MNAYSIARYPTMYVMHDPRSAEQDHANLFAQDANRQLLASGFENVKCLKAESIQERSLYKALEVLQQRGLELNTTSIRISACVGKDERISGFEHFANGGFNLFIRDCEPDRQVGYIKILIEEGYQLK